jgi:hypothetical protein
MKSILFLAVALAITFTSFAKGPGVSEKVLAAFNKTFGDAKEVVWTETNNTFEATFKQREIQIRVYYDQDGNITKTLRYYGEEHLPLMVLSKIKTKYSDKKIFGITEESSEDGLYFHVVLEDEKSWLEVKSDVYGSVSETKKMKKG